MYFVLELLGIWMLLGTATVVMLNGVKQTVIRRARNANFR